MTKETTKTKALYEIETTSDSDGNIHVLAWIVKDQSTGEWVNGKTTDSFIKFLKRDASDNHIYSKSRELLNEIVGKD